jgi:hypothetical protein
MTDPAILRRMEAGTWHYAFGDDRAFAVLRQRIADVGRKQQLISYSDLVAGVEFRLPNVSEQPLVVDVHEWRDIDRAIVGEFLGRASLESYRDHGFMASALAVSKDTKAPSELFFSWMLNVGAIRDRSEDAKLKFWSEQVRLVYAHYDRTQSQV